MDMEVVGRKVVNTPLDTLSFIVSIIGGVIVGAIFIGILIIYLLERKRKKSAISLSKFIILWSICAVSGVLGWFVAIQSIQLDKSGHKKTFVKVKGEAVVQKYESDGDMLIAHLKEKNKFNIYLSKDDELNQKNRFDEAIRSR